MIELLICLGLGYLLGTFNPAAMFAKAKHIDLRREGTGNLGATNTLLVMGKGWGILVMLLDVGKAYLSYKLARRLFPHLAIAGLVAGLGAILGHIFPFYMNFKGGKGLAAYGGMILAYDPKMFLFLFVTAVILMLIVNYSRRPSVCIGSLSGACGHPDPQPGAYADLHRCRGPDRFEKLVHHRPHPPGRG